MAIMTEEMYERLAAIWGCKRQQITKDGENLVVTLSDGTRALTCPFVEALRNLVGVRGEWN
jgi:hypothetical protein